MIPIPSPACSPSTSVTDTWVEDLELMHHYTAHAYLTIPGDDRAKQTWGFAVTQEAFRHKFLMHCILAFAASHLAHIDPQAQSRHRIQASTHQATGIAQINDVLGDITATNCHALFAATSLITLNAFAESTHNNVGGLLDIFQLIRGMNIILKDNEDTIRNGSFRPIIFPPSPNQSRPLPPLVSSCMLQLRALMKETEVCSPTACTAANHLLEALQFGIDKATPIAMRAVMFWPIKVEQEFLDAVEARQDDSMRVMQQYLRIVNLTGTEFWFMSSWRNISW